MLRNIYREQGKAMQKIIELKNISKSFDGEKVLDNINLYINDNEFLTLLGPSGCGKTTTLRLIGGFVQPDEGDVMFLGERINDMPPYKRNVNTVFQRYALFPHLNVFENVAFPLREQRLPKDEINSKVNEMLELVKLPHLAKRRINELSGGQQQRVSIARALVGEPPIILADEPTGALDSRTGREVLALLKQLNKQGKTVVLITHDNSIAVQANRIIRLGDGRVVYDGPADSPGAMKVPESEVL